MNVIIATGGYRVPAVPGFACEWTSGGFSDSPVPADKEEPGLDPGFSAMRAQAPSSSPVLVELPQHQQAHEANGKHHTHNVCRIAHPAELRFTVSQLNISQRTCLHHPPSPFPVPLHFHHRRRQTRIVPLPRELPSPPRAAPVQQTRSWRWRSTPTVRPDVLPPNGGRCFDRARSFPSVFSVMVCLLSYLRTYQ